VSDAIAVTSFALRTVPAGMVMSRSGGAAGAGGVAGPLPLAPGTTVNVRLAAPLTVRVR